MQPEPNDDDDPIGPLTEAFVQSYRRGEAPNIQQWADQHPALAERIVKLFPTLVVMEELSFDEPPAGYLTANLTANELPRQIGDYCIQEELGRGGMGVVYRARQNSLGREVALKVLSSPLLSQARALERFRFEARTAGQLNHPNIVPVYDVGQAGTTHFYAMQLINGQSLDRIIDEARQRDVTSNSTTIRSTDEDVTLVLPTGVFNSENKFVAADLRSKQREPSELPVAADSDWKGNLVVPESSSTNGPNDHGYQRIAKIGYELASAIAFAHENDILHRDVKPSNVILDKRDHVWVTDFGLAKALDFAKDNLTDFTATGDVVGTIRYMPPERFRGWSDTRSDIYGIGITLYELLTLQPAFDSTDQLELIEKIRTSKPLRPRLVNRRIPRDLETIVLKAIENEPGARYATASEMADDFRRFSENRPILARRSSSFEKVRQWSRRNPGTASISAAFVLFIIGALAMTAVLWRQAEASAREATNNLGLAISAIDQYCTKVSEDLRLKEQDLRPLRKELLSTAVEFQEQLIDLRKRSGTAQIELARTYANLAKLSMEIDASERAVALFRSAINEYQTVSADTTDAPSIDLELATCYRDFAESLYRSAKAEEANEAIQRSVKILEQCLVAGPTSMLARAALADVRSMQAYRARGSGQFDESETFARMAIAEWSSLAEASPGDPGTLSNWAYVESQLGKAIFDRDNTRWREAEELLLEALKRARQSTSLSGVPTQYSVRQADILRGLGRINNTRGMSNEAILYQTEAVEIFGAARRKEPTVRLHTIMQAGVYTEMAQAFRRKGDTATELAKLQMAIELLESVILAYPGDRSVEVQFVETAGQLGQSRLNSGDLVGSEVVLDRAIEMAEKNLEESPQDFPLGRSYPVILQNRAILRSKLGRTAEASEDHDRAVAVARENERGPRRISRGEFHLQQGDHRRAMTDLRAALSELSPETSARNWAWVLMNGAKLSARCAGVANSDDKLSAEERATLTEEYAATSVELLNKAIQNGFPHIDSLRTMPEFESLRDREDFNAFFR